MRVIDQLGRVVDFSFPPKRIVSLVPSQTELLFDLGLGDKVVGVDRYCIHPAEWKESKAKVGGTKKIDFEAIRSLNPDLIIGNKEENDRDQIEALSNNYPVWLSDISSIEEAFQMIAMIGAITDTSLQAESICRDTKFEMSKLPAITSQRVLYLIWRKPWMAAGKGTFIHSMLNAIGFENAVADTRYPEFSDRDITGMAPDLIFLSSEPYPFKDAHIAEIGKLSPQSKIKLVDGEMFSWYGSRMRLAPAYLSTLLI